MCLHPTRQRAHAGHERERGAKLQQCLQIQGRGRRRRDLELRFGQESVTREGDHMHAGIAGGSRHGQIHHGEAGANDQDPITHVGGMGGNLGRVVPVRGWRVAAGQHDLIRAQPLLADMQEPGCRSGQRPYCGHFPAQALELELGRGVTLGGVQELPQILPVECARQVRVAVHLRQPPARKLDQLLRRS